MIKKKYKLIHIKIRAHSVEATKYKQTNKQNVLLHYYRNRVTALTQHVYDKPKGFSGKIENAISQFGA